jgi:hypothetical protein
VRVRRERANSGFAGPGRGRPGDRLAPVSEEPLEAQGVTEEPVPAGEGEVAEPRALPAKPRPGELEAWRGEVRTAAIAAAGGIVAGAATVAAVRAVRAGGARVTRRRGGVRRTVERPVVASRSFLIDVHVLGK